MGGIRFDVENQLSTKQAFTGASTVSTDSYQKQTAAQDISIGRRMALLVMATVAADPAATHVLEAIQATNGALTTGVKSLGKVEVLGSQLVPGKEIEVPIPQGVMDAQFLGFRHSATGGTSQAVTLDVYLVPQDENPMFKTFPKVVHAAT